MHYKTFIPKLRFLFCIVGFFAASNLHAQHNAEQVLLQRIQQATSNTEKLQSLSSLTNYYYALNNDLKADSLQDVQLMVAENSRSEVLILAALFPVYDNNVVYNSSNGQIDKKLVFANRALEYARSVNKNDYVALAYAALAKIYRNSGQPDLALTNADIAYTTAIGSGNDSVKVVTALELGRVFMEKKDLLMAFRKFSNAYDIANNLRNPYLLSSVYNHFALLYDRLRRTEQGKQYLFKSIEINSEAGHTRDLIRDYIAMGKMADFISSKSYLDSATRLADSIQDPVLALQAKQTLFNQYMINDKCEHTFQFLSSNPDVERSLRGQGEYNYEWIIAEIFLYCQKFDSAYVYFKKAEPAYGITFNVPGRINFFSELADCSIALKHNNEAIQYFTTVLQLANNTQNMTEKKHCLKALQELYWQAGDFKNAYEYANRYNLLQDSVNNLNKERDFVLGEIDNENKRIQKETELKAQAIERRHDAQYMLISVTIAVLFLLLVFLGLFTVSTTTIRVLGFFSFIFLFELITLLLDTWIHNKTHGEPWKIWLIKIGIISMLYPFHHWLEHKFIHYLLNKKLIHVGSFFPIRRWTARLFKKRTAPVVETTEAVDLPPESPLES